MIPNIISDLIHNPRGVVFRHIREVGEGQVCTSIIVAAELRYGATQKRSPPLTTRVEGVLSSLDILSFESPADVTYGILRVRLEQAGRPMGATASSLPLKW